MKALPMMCASLLLVTMTGSALAARATKSAPSAKSATSAPAVVEIGQYQVTQHFKPGGDGGWDYLTVDPDARRLYFGRSTRVQVLDSNTGALIGEIPDTPGIHGVALAPELGRGYTSNGRDSSVTVFDLKTLATVTKIRIDQRNPDAILYEPVTKRIFTFNGGSASATAIDATTDNVVGTLPLGDKPEFAVADGKGMVFVNLEDSSVVVQFDARTLAIQSRWSLAPGQTPTGLAIDLAHQRLFSVCGNDTMIVLDTESGKVVSIVPIGKGVDAAAFDPATRLAFASNGEGTLTVIREETPDRFTVLATVPTQRAARTMALDTKTHRIFAATAQFGEPPAPTAERPRPRPPMVPGSFEILVLDPVGKTGSN